MNSYSFIKELSKLDFENTFNPYSERCNIHDLDDAPQRRSRMLLSVLTAAVEQDIDSIWIGRDLGYRGGRRTGLALTDDAHIHAHTGRWGVSTERPTKGAVVTERTAAVVWDVISQIRVSIFLWNVFPLHPHESNNPFSNRPHNHLERKIGEDFLSHLMLLLKPRRLIAIGNDAARTAHRLSDQHNIVQIRHPSYGGQTQFLAQIRDLYDLSVPATHKTQLKRGI